MGSPRDSHAATLLADGRVLVTDGSSGLPSAEIYDPVTDTWSPPDPMRRARLAHTATLLADGRVLVTGGINDSTSGASAEIYDPVTGTWSLTAPMRSARTDHTATLLADGRVLVTGGDNDISSGLADAEIYDPATDDWSLTGSMSEPRTEHTATLLADGRVLVTGGDTSSSSGLSSAEIYNPATQTWAPARPMSSPRYVHRATLLLDGRVLVTGGFSTSTFLDSAEIYNPATDTWLLTQEPMHGERDSHTATLLADGRVLVTGGGGNGSSALDSAEIYDPAIDTWSLTTRPMNSARSDHTATLLADGRVLVTGGSDESAPLDSAEVFDPDGVSETLAFASAAFTVDEFGTAPVALITVVRTGGSAVPVTVQYATSAGTATAGVDYMDVSGTLTFGPGDTTATFEVPILNDPLTEAAETINLTLSNPGGGAVLGAPNTAILTIAENDIPRLSFSTAQYTAPTEPGLATITVNRTGGLGTVIAVAYATGDLTARAGQDYSAARGTLTFGANETSKRFTVAILEDLVAEGAETISLTLSNPTGGAVLGARPTAILEILANDGAVLQFSAATYTAAAEEGSRTITVTRTGVLGTTVRVNYATSNGTATVGQDYTARAGTLTFPANVTSRTFAVPIRPDTRTEGAESINLTLSQPTAGAVLGARRTAVLTIPANDTPRLQFDTATYTAAAESGERTITVTRTGGFGTVVSVAYATSNGTAAAGQDYTTRAGRLTFGANDTRKTFTVPIRPDNAPEGPETINLTLSSPGGGAVLGTPSRAVLTIPPSDVALLQFSAPSYASLTQPGSVTITVTRTGGFGTIVSVAYATSNGTAIAGQDYTASSGRLTFQANDTTKAFVVPILGSTAGEVQETINLQLSAVQGGATLGAQRTAVIAIAADESCSGCGP